VAGVKFGRVVALPLIFIVYPTMLQVPLVPRPVSSRVQYHTVETDREKHKIQDRVTYCEWRVLPAPTRTCTFFREHAKVARTRVLTQSSRENGKLTFNPEHDIPGSGA